MKLLLTRKEKEPQSYEKTLVGKLEEQIIEELEARSSFGITQPGGFSELQPQNLQTYLFGPANTPPERMATAIPASEYFGG